MKNYRLTASGWGQTIVRLISAPDDSDAIWQALACFETEGKRGHLWRKGKIVLADEEGRIIVTMAAKS
jgi:hypothetical protein